MNYAGIDHHRQHSPITWLDEKGEVVKSGREAKLVGALLRTYAHLEERINETNILVKELYEKMPSAFMIG